MTHMQRLWTCAPFGLLLSTAGSAQVLYHAWRIPPPPPYSSTSGWINNSGQVATRVQGYPLPNPVAARWDPVTGWLLLGTVPGFWPETSSYAINDLGHVAGDAWKQGGGYQGFFWSPATGMLAIGSLTGPSGWSYVKGMNDLDQVVGTSGTPDSEAFLWDLRADPPMIGLGDLPGGGSAGRDINNAGWVVGESSSGTGINVFIWTREEGMRPLWNIPPNHYPQQGNAINELCQVCGQVWIAPGYIHPYLWDPQAGLTVIPKPPGQWSALAQDVNDSGQVVGYFLPALGGNWVPFLWDGAHGMRLLVDVLDAASRPLTFIGQHVDINNRGQIVTVALGPSGVLVLDPFLLGDMNCDGAVDLDDVVPFVIALVDPPGHAQQYPGCHGDWAGDINQDAVVNAFDIDPFVALLAGGYP